MNEFNAVIFAAVSTRAQAEDDRFSIPNQLAETRKWIKASKVCEAHKPLIVKGNTREYIRLEHAERDIPEIREMFELARNGRINLVVLYSYHRWRNIMIPIQMTLAAYGCQTYSVTDGGNLMPPDEFTPYANDATTMTIGLANMMSRLDINKLRRYYFAGMPKRVTELGIPWGRIPWGYQKPKGITDPKAFRKATPIQVKSICSIILRMKSDYMRGRSGQTIANDLNAKGILSPMGKKWNHSAILKVITNPFYAGYVHYGGRRSRRDPLSGEIATVYTGEITMAKGKHDPLWSLDDYNRILARRKAIAKGQIGKTKSTRLFSRLIRCAICGGLVVADSRERSGDTRIFYRCRCSVNGRAHVKVNEDDLFNLFRIELGNAAKQMSPIMPNRTVSSDSRRARLIIELQENDEKKTRCQRAYSDGVWTFDDMKARMVEINAQRSELQAQLAEIDAEFDQASRGQEVVEMAKQLLISYDALKTLPSESANALLTEIVDHFKMREQVITDIQFRS